MKTIKNISLIGLLTILVSLNLNATMSLLIDGEPAFSKPIIVSIIITDEAIANEFFFDDEEYINDIPFDINSILDQCKIDKQICEDFYLDEEGYIDDIPFNTKVVLDTLTSPSVVWYSDKY